MQKMIENLKNNGFFVTYVKDGEEAMEYILSELEPGVSIGMGGSVTLRDIQAYEKLEEKGFNPAWHWKWQNPKEAIQKAKEAKVYLTSTNAITEDGILVNIDGNGNRVAALCSGPSIVYVVVGKNKICKDYKDAKKRIENIAAPLNAKRVGVNTPCTITGKCSDCSSPERICRAEVITRRCPSAMQIKIVLIDQELGF